MSRTQMITTAIVLSLWLSGCDLVTETQWLSEQGW